MKITLSLNDLHELLRSSNDGCVFRLRKRATDNKWYITAGCFNSWCECFDNSALHCVIDDLVRIGEGVLLLDDIGIDASERPIGSLVNDIHTRTEYCPICHYEGQTLF